MKLETLPELLARVPELRQIFSQDWMRGRSCMDACGVWLKSNGDLLTFLIEIPTFNITIQGSLQGIWLRLLVLVSSRV